MSSYMFANFQTCDEAEGIKCANREMQRADRPTDIYEVRVAGNGKGLGVFAIKLIKKVCD